MMKIVNLTVTRAQMEWASSIACLHTGKFFSLYEDIRRLLEQENERRLLGKLKSGEEQNRSK